MTYRFVVTEPAEQDRDCCYRYIFERSPEGALRWLDAYEQAIDSLKANAIRSLAPENSDHVEEIRQCLFKTRHGLQYRLLFRSWAETTAIE